MLRRIHLMLLALLTSLTLHTTAQGQSDAYWEIRPIAGVAVPLGAHRSVFGNAAFVGAGSSIRLSASWDLVGSFAIRSQTAKYPVADGRVHVLVYNAGVERLYRPSDRTTRGTWVPFVGLGLGGRANDFRSRELSSTSCYAAYGNAGIAYEKPRTALRLEIRDNVFCYRSPIAPFNETGRNEASVGFGAGIRF